MNHKQAKELLSVFTAFANGEEVERRGCVGMKWLTSIRPCWYTDVEYRIKPKVKEGWVLPANLHQNNPDCHDDECILVREVERDI